MRNALLFALLTGLFFLLTFCTKKDHTTADESPWLNQNDTVQYVGMETCALCHADREPCDGHEREGE